jgi:hypothetical protein
VLRGMDPIVRRQFLGMAVSTEGLTLSTLSHEHNGLKKMLDRLLVPVRDGSSKLMLATSYHQGAMMAST